jgi:general secretion pathway protein N
MQTPSQKKSGKYTIFQLFIVTYLITLCALAPASLLDAALRHASDDKFALANATGTLWNGSALLTLKARDGIRQPLQSLHWRIAAGSLFTGKLRAQLNGDDASTSTAEATLSFNGLELQHARFQLPALILDEAAPVLRPARFRGQFDFRTEQMTLSANGINGAAIVDWQHASSALSRIAPLGDYRLTLDGAGANVRIGLTTVSGVLLLDGQGNWQADRGLVFQGTARAAAGSEDHLAELLHHLGLEMTAGVHSFSLVPQ